MPRSMVSTIAYLCRYRSQRCCDLKRACWQASAIGIPPEQRARASPKQCCSDGSRLNRMGTRSTDVNLETRKNMITLEACRLMTDALLEVACFEHRDHAASPDRLRSPQGPVERCAPAALARRAVGGHGDPLCLRASRPPVSLAGLDNAASIPPLTGWRQYCSVAPTERP
jgi:hypothetical protein